MNELAHLQPDFVTLSEVRNYNDVDFTHMLCQALKEKGLTYYSFRSKDSGLLSKHPIIDWTPVFPENRDHGSIYKLVSKVQGVEVAVYTGHLDYLDCAYYNVRGYDGNTFKETKKPETIEEVLRLNDLSWRDNAVQIFLNELATILQQDAAWCLVATSTNPRTSIGYMPRPIFTTTTAWPFLGRCRLCCTERALRIAIENYTPTP